MGQRSGTAASKRASRTRILLVEADPLRRQALARVLRLAGYRVHAFSRAANALHRAGECDVVVLAALGPNDAHARSLIANVRNGHANGHRRRRVGVICPDALTAADLKPQADRLFLAPLDCGALLRWIAVGALSHVVRTNQDWAHIFASLNDRPGVLSPPGMNGDRLKVVAD